MSENIVIYTKPGCPFCAAAKEDFNSKGIEYTEHDVTADESAREEAYRLSGVSAVPVIIKDGEVTVGFGGT